MISKLKQSFFLISSILILASCGSKTSPFENVVKSEEHIAFVGSINAQQIIDKGDFWKEFGWIKMFTGKMLDSNEWGMNIFSKKDILITADESGEQEFAIVMFKINNAEKFGKHLGELTLNEKEEYEKFFLVANERTEDFSIAWDENMGIAIGGIKDGVDVKEKLKTIISNIGNPKEKELSEEVKNVITSNDDMRFIAYTSKLKNRYTKDFANDEEVMKLLEGAYFESTLNGEAGSINFIMEAKGMDKFINSPYNITSQTGVAENVLATAVADDFMGLISFSLEKSRLTDLIKQQMTGRTASDSIGAEMSKQMMKVITGDVAISMNNIEMEDDMSGVKVVVGIEDVEGLIKLLDSLPDFNRVSDIAWKTKNAPLLSGDENQYLTPDMIEEIEKQQKEQEVYLTILDKTLIITDTIAEPLKPMHSASDFPEALAKPFFIKLDMEKLAEMDAIPDDVFEMFESIKLVKGGSDIKNTTLNIQFKDESQNGWKQLFKMLGGQMMSII